MLAPVGGPSAQQVRFVGPPCGARGLLRLALQDDHRDLASRPRLVIRELRIQLGLARIELVPLYAPSHRCLRLEGVRPDLHGDGWIRDQVVVPVGARGGAALRGKDHQALAIPQVH